MRVQDLNFTQFASLAAADPSVGFLINGDRIRTRSADPRCTVLRSSHTPEFKPSQVENCGPDAAVQMGFPKLPKFNG